MIKARWTAPTSLTITGHAGYAERGKDIVCAGVSTLWGTLIAELEDRDWNGEGELSIKDGTVAFRAKDEKAIEGIYSICWRGILLLAARYGEYIDAERTF